MLASILVLSFVILGLFLSMLSSPPKADLDDTMPFSPHPEENLPTGA